MAIFKKRKVDYGVEMRFQKAVDLFKDLDRREFKRLMEGLELAWEGYNKIRQVQTTDEKESAEIAEVENVGKYEETI